MYFFFPGVDAIQDVTTWKLPDSVAAQLYALLAYSPSGLESSDTGSRQSACRINGSQPAVLLTHPKAGSTACWTDSFPSAPGSRAEPDPLELARGKC